MVKKSGYVLGSTFFLQLALGVFFVVLGISSIESYRSTSSELKRALGNSSALSLIAAVLELAIGLILVLGLFMSVSNDLTKFLGFALFTLWVLYMLLVFLIRNFLEPNPLTWLYRLSWHSVILVSLWKVGRKYL